MSRFLSWIIPIGVVAVLAWAGASRISAGDTVVGWAGVGAAAVIAGCIAFNARHEIRTAARSSRTG